MTSGMKRVWQIVLENANLSTAISVLGGGRITDGMVMTGETKQDLVCRLRGFHKKYVYAIGDSPIDLGMLREAHRAYVVVGGESFRSRSMDAALEEAITDDGLVVDQILLPDTVSARLDTGKVPIVRLSDTNFGETLVRRRPEHASIRHILATDKPAALLLATDMRDSAISGPALRKVHQQVGAYLATEYLGDVVGLEQKPISHVLGHATYGSRIANESKTTIVALMRGGEPMAFGVNEILPQAMFLHSDAGRCHLRLREETKGCYVSRLGHKYR